MTEQDWKEAIKEIVKSELKEWKPPESKQSPPSSSETYSHWKADDLLKPDCPQCVEEAAKLKAKLGPEWFKDRKDLEYECEECGTPVREDEEQCPTCGGKDARERK